MVSAGCAKKVRGKVGGEWRVAWLGGKKRLPNFSPRRERKEECKNYCTGIDITYVPST